MTEDERNDYEVRFLALEMAFADLWARHLTPEQFQQILDDDAQAQAKAKCHAGAIVLPTALNERTAANAAISAKWARLARMAIAYRESLRTEAAGAVRSAPASV